MKLNSTTRSRLQLAVMLLAFIVLAARFQLRPNDPSDLYPVWLGAGEVLRGSDPYRPELSERIQLKMYGRPLTDDELQHGRDQHRFVYPAFVAFILAPLTFLSYNTAQAIACGLFAALIAVSIPCWMRAVGWRPPPAILAWIVVIVLLSPISRRALSLVQVGVLAGFLLAATARSVARNHLVLAGVLLAISSFKPQVALVPTAWLVLWSLSALEKRWQLLLGWALTLGVLVAASAAVVPEWIVGFLHGMTAYRHYTGAPSAFDAIFGHPWSALPTFIAFVGLAIVAWKARAADASTRQYALALTLALAVTAWAMPANFDTYNQLLSLPMVFLLGRMAEEKNSRLRHAELPT
jgi:hypothetical protein